MNSNVTTDSTTNASSTGQKLGQGVKGLFNTVHGAGEVLRGNINAAIDGVGDGVAGRQGPVSATQPTAHASVAAGGEAEVSKGIRQMTGGGSAQPVAMDSAGVPAKPVPQPLGGPGTRPADAPPTHPGSRI